ncbi:TIGR02679 family protein [Promicromonospora sp. NPDC023987]|uniref:TIGR02679 family protein n=1 Tax=Promicromonospora sp. NPDC023987 TaxID=3155360 RepID=UPI0033C6822D
MTVPAHEEEQGNRGAIESLLGGPGARWIVERVRRRLESEPSTGSGQRDSGGSAGAGPETGELPVLSGSVRLAGPTAEQRDAVVRLVGRPRQAGAGVTIDLAVVEQILRRGPWPAGLADAVITLTGPLTDRRGDRIRAAEAWDRARSELEPALARFDGLAAWWAGWCAAGNLKRATRAELARLADRPVPVGASGGPDAADVAVGLVGRVRTVLEALPVSDEPIAVLARRTVGDAHGLDASRPLGRTAAAVVGAAFGPSAPPNGAQERTSERAAWAYAGVVMSNVASTVLSLGVPGAAGTRGSGIGGTATARILEEARGARMPVVLTLDQVRSGGVDPLGPGGVVHVCENPTVVEVVAARWAAVEDSGTRPGLVLVCTSGQPSTAVVELVQVLTQDGALLKYHGDFDWAGLRIADGLRRRAPRAPWVPWRYTAADYEAAVRDGGPSLKLSGTPAASPWDEALSAAMLDRGQSIEEEAVVDLLASNLTGSRP